MAMVWSSCVMSAPMPASTHALSSLACIETGREGAWRGWSLGGGEGREGKGRGGWGNIAQGGGEGAEAGLGQAPQSTSPHLHGSVLALHAGQVAAQQLELRLHGAVLRGQLLCLGLQRHDLRGAVQWWGGEASCSAWVCSAMT